MNAGLIVGHVHDRGGAPVSEADVWMYDLHGMAGGRIMPTGDQNVRDGSPITKSNSKGYFELAFAWSGTEIGTAIGSAGRVKMSISAMKTIWQNESSNTTYEARPQQILGYLLKDVLGQAGLTPPDLKSLQGKLELAKDVLDAVAGLKSHPVFKVQMLTSESWLLLSAAQIVINKY